METTHRPWDSHPSLDASLQDFETPYEEPQHASQAFEFRPEKYLTGSPTGAALRPASSETDMDSDAGSASDSTGPWSPPNWRRSSPNGWFNPHEKLLSASLRNSPVQSRQNSPEHATEGDTTLAPEGIPLPGSPLKGRSPSPSPEPGYANGQRDLKAVVPAAIDQQSQNLRAEVQHRTEPIEAAMRYMYSIYERITSSRWSLFRCVTVAFIAWLVCFKLSQVPERTAGPDLVKVAGLAKNFEPLIHYSENSFKQIGELQDTGVAVWDLGESVRLSNMTSAPIITKQLDELSANLTTLAKELTEFFAQVDGDVDSILLVMEWAKRELLQVSAQVPGSMEGVFENISLLVHKIGGEAAGQFLTTLLGKSHTQLTKSTLQRTFDEFLNVMEEAINHELQYSTALFALFEAIDQRFLNLQRTVIRETDSQEQKLEQELASLWGRMLGPNAQKLAKFEKNKKLLLSIKERTVANKRELIDHNGRLLQLKSNLEILRRRLVGSLVRSNASSTLSIEEQIGGLSGTYELLKSARDKQQGRAYEALASFSSRRGALHGVGEDAMIDG